MTTRTTAPSRRSRRLHAHATGLVRYPATRRPPWRWGEQLELFPVPGLDRATPAAPSSEQD